MSDRLPSAFRFLGIVTAAWLGWRVPVAVEAVEMAHRAQAGIAQIATKGAAALAPIPVRRAAHAAWRDMARLGAGTKNAAVRQVVSRLQGDEGASTADQALPDPWIEIPIPANASIPALKGDGGALADRTYALLRQGERRAAAGLLAQAVALSPADPRVRAWRADRRMLTQRWQGYAGVHVRGGRAAGPEVAGLGLAPSLGGSQAVVRLGYVINPLSDRRMTIAGRVYAPLRRQGAGWRSAQAVLGLEIRPIARVPLSLAVERYAALGMLGRDAWSLRLSGGVDDAPLAGGLRISAYGDAGLIGARSRDGFVQGQAVMFRRIEVTDTARIGAGLGLWGAVQPGVSRIDAGPSLSARVAAGRVTIGGQLDYRVRLAGRARPGSGPALTVQAGF